MKILIDTNIILDIILNRENFVENSKNVLKLSKNKNNTLYITSSTVTDIYYIVNKKYHNKGKTILYIKKILKFIRILEVNEQDILSAIRLDWNDFEDSVLYATCENKNIDIIVTRNKSDFKEKNIRIFTPEEVLEIM